MLVLFAYNILNKYDDSLSISFMCAVKNRGPKIEPCGAPHVLLFFYFSPL